MQEGVLEIDRLSFERRLWRKGYRFIAGVDEVGRGPLAGPVLACAVIFSVKFFHSAVRDSKKLSSGKRLELARMLRQEAVAIGIGQASPGEIDDRNIRQASFTAMQRAVSKLEVTPDFILIDGNDSLIFLFRQRPLSKGTTNHSPLERRRS